MPFGTHSGVSWAKYRSSRNIVNVALHKAKSAFYASQIENVTGNHKKAWKTVNDILGRKQRADDVREIKINDHSVTSPEEIVEKFNDCFTSIGPSLAQNIDNNEFNYRQFFNRVDSSFHFQPVSSSQVYKLLNSLSVCKTSGIEKISAKDFKWAAQVVCESLMQIFIRSIVAHVFPNEWKVARRNALHKKGPSNMLDNYRPISILLVVSKGFEKILYKQLVEYLDSENLLSEHQFDFRCSHSTVSALLDFSNEWHCNMDCGLYNLVVSFLTYKRPSRLRYGKSCALAW